MILIQISKNPDGTPKILTTVYYHFPLGDNVRVEVHPEEMERRILKHIEICKEIKRNKNGK